MESDKPKLILFLHFHRAGGTSIVRMLSHAGKAPHTPHVNGNPWFEDRSGLIEFWHFDRQRFNHWIDEIVSQGVEFIACEWDFLCAENRRHTDRLALITCLRDPFERMISNYVSKGGDQRWGDIRRWYDSEPLWWKRRSSKRSFPLSHNLPNHYVRMLNGLGTDPTAVLDHGSLEEARRSLRLFESIVILEIPDSFGRLSRYGISGPVLRLNGRNRNALDIPRGFREEFIEQNALDYELYKYARDICQNVPDAEN
jgi:hypothetical protein